MKFIICLSFVFLLSGCTKITELTSSKTTDIEQVGDPVHDEKTEMKILVPWDLFV